MIPRKHNFALLSTLVLAACGGGGSDSGGDSPSPLAKYVGTYAFCDGNEKVQLSISTIDSRSISLIQRSDYYMDRNCVGAVVGTETQSAPLTATYVSTGTSTVIGYPSASSVATYVVDRLSINVPALTVSLTGTGVTTINGQSCVVYSNGRACIGGPPTPAQGVVGGLAFTDVALLLLTGTATGYERDVAFPR